MTKLSSQDKRGHGRLPEGFPWGLHRKGELRCGAGELRCGAGPPPPPPSRDGSEAAANLPPAMAGSLQPGSRLLLGRAEPSNEGPPRKCGRRRPRSHLGRRRDEEKMGDLSGVRPCSLGNPQKAPEGGQAVSGVAGEGTVSLTRLPGTRGTDQQLGLSRAGSGKGHLARRAARPSQGEATCFGDAWSLFGCGLALGHRHPV